MIALNVNFVFADEIFITRTNAEDTIFDGKWSFLQEWKSTSEDKISFSNSERFVIKTGHDYENIYVLVDFISDTKNDVNSDRGVICFDTGNEKNKIPDKNDYCFWIVSGSKTIVALNGNSMFSSLGNWKNISPNVDVLAAAGISDQHDRYSNIPHMTYEFKIPIQLIGKTNVYGFYVATYDGSTEKWFTWPKDSASNNYPFISSPANWGELVSPDKSIPEFSFTWFGLAILFIPLLLKWPFNKLVLPLDS